ncbi:MAG: MFS transporter [Acidobacteria bacterium]|nr:MFS transporter [Acidobacteriota bacterium]
MNTKREHEAPPWYRQLTGTQKKAFLTTFSAWVLDAFDFTILTFVLVDIQNSFSVNKALAGLLGTVTLVFRVMGGIGAGAAADRWGRRGPILFSIAWFTVFAFLSGLSTSYVMLFAFRGLFGVGMGGMWAAGVPLALEHLPARLRGAASGLLQGGFSFGFMLSSLVYQLGWPWVSANPDRGWRLMLWAGIIPSIVVFAFMTTVKESPVWLSEQERRAAEGATPRVSIARLFDRDLRWVTLHTSLLMGTFIFSYHSISFWYPTLLASRAMPPLGYLVALNAGGLLGSVILGQVSETRLGRRGAPTLGMIVGLGAAPLYLLSSDPTWLLLGALLIGLGCSGAWGIVPGYLSERFPTEARAVGTGFAYHVGAGLGSFTPFLIGAVQDRGTPLPVAMLGCIIVAGVLVVGMLWIGPETRGTSLDDR